MPEVTRSHQPKLLDEVRPVLRLHHSSLHTERSSVDRIVRFVRFHGLRSRQALFPAEPKIEAFLTDLAVRGHVAPATQNQAMHALVFLSKRVLTHAPRGSINAVRADKKINVPVVMTREEVATVLLLMDGTAQLRVGSLRPHRIRPVVTCGEPSEFQQYLQRRSSRSMICWRRAAAGRRTTRVGGPSHPRWACGISGLPC